MAKANEKLIVCRGYSNPILNCVGKKAESEYYTSWSKFDNGKTCYCKKCVNNIYDYYLKEFNDEKSAMFYTCAKIDIPFRKDVYEVLLNRIEEAKQNGRNVSINIGLYINELQRKSTQKEILSDFSATNFDINDTITTTMSAEAKQKELDELTLKWGNQDNLEDYDFLERTYNRYMVNFEDELSPQQQDTLCDLCRDRLLLRKLSESSGHDNDMITKVQNRVNGLMKTLKIDNFDGNQKRTLSEQSFIEKTRIMENYKPMEIYADNTDYTSYNKRKKYYTDLVLRPLCNTLAGHKDFNIDMSDLEQYNLNGDKK